MKALKFTLVALAIAFGGIIITSYLIWVGYPSKNINILIMDKTVRDFKYSQHRSLVWVLNNTKFLKQDGGNYKVSSDYFGFHPLKPLSDRQYEIKRITLENVVPLSEQYDATYFTDTYGVFFNEWFRGFRRGSGNSVIEGGLNQNDYLFLKTMKEKNKLVIGEYNIFWGVTSELNRYKTEELFGVHTTGWTGKYFSSLDSTYSSEELEILIAQYRANTGNNWSYSGSGIILVNREKVVVLEYEEHLNTAKPAIVTNDSFALVYNLPRQINYLNWFEINTVSDTIDVISIFELNLTRKGQDIFDELGLKPVFPAVSAFTANNKNIYYFSADFSNNSVKTFYSRLANSRKMLKYFTANEKKKFFQMYYFPLIENILTNYTAVNQK